MSGHNAQADTVKTEMPTILGTEQIISSTSSTTSASDSSMPQTPSEVITSSTTLTMSQHLVPCEDEKVISSMDPAISQENTMEGKIEIIHNGLLFITIFKTN